MYEQRPLQCQEQEGGPVENVSTLVSCGEGDTAVNLRHVVWLRVAPQNGNGGVYRLEAHLTTSEMVILTMGPEVEMRELLNKLSVRVMSDRSIQAIKEAKRLEAAQRKRQMEAVRRVEEAEQRRMIKEEGSVFDLGLPVVTAKRLVDAKLIDVRDLVGVSEKELVERSRISPTGQALKGIKKALAAYGLELRP